MYTAVDTQRERERGGERERERERRFHATHSAKVEITPFALASMPTALANIIAALAAAAAAGRVDAV